MEKPWFHWKHLLLALAYLNEHTPRVSPAWGALDGHCTTVYPIYHKSEFCWSWYSFICCRGKFKGTPKPVWGYAYPKSHPKMGAPPPTNKAPDMGSLKEETNLPATLPEVPCQWKGGYVSRALIDSVAGGLGSDSIWHHPEQQPCFLLGWGGQDGCTNPPCSASGNKEVSSTAGQPVVPSSSCLVTLSPVVGCFPSEHAPHKVLPAGSLSQACAALHEVLRGPLVARAKVGQ